MPLPAVNGLARNCTFVRKRSRSASRFSSDVDSDIAETPILIRRIRLQAIRAKLAEQRKHIDELDKHMYAPPFSYSRNSFFPLLHTKLT